MKKQSNNLLAPISKENIENLTGIVKETLATGFNHPNSKVFNAVSLWNIQRLGKSSLQKRHFF